MTNISIKLKMVFSSKEIFIPLKLVGSLSVRVWY